MSASMPAESADTSTPHQSTSSSLSLDYKNMANSIRALAMDAVEKANSGHPGMPMGMADVATVLYSNFLKFDPENPTWPDRDRFILSAGHGSMLLYALNYLTGYANITLDEIKNFRQLHSKTPGHPEVDPESGIETTTGPLGQGISTAVGFALAERILNARHGDNNVDHTTWIIASDGDLMEGISHEACSLAGHLKLSKLIVLYDDNGITIDGSTDLSFTENIPERFKSYNWDVQEIDGHNFEDIAQAITKAQTTNTPSLICCKTKIGFGAPTKEGSAASHGAALGSEEIEGARKNLDWPHAPFEIPGEILQQWRSISQKGKEAFGVWEQKKTTDIGISLSELDTIIQDLKDTFAKEKPNKATRQTSGMCLEKLVAALPELIGGSADLTGSNNTKTAASRNISSGDYSGNYMNYGVREHGMAAIMNGMALHGGLIPYSGTFLQFADYARPAIRLAALMKQRVIHVMTHDSIGLGEDGPTHQPVEHLAALRAIPNCYLFRPCDGIETAECWEIALKQDSAPSVMALTRQGLPTLRGASKENLSAKGAYILQESNDTPQVILFASGSEVSLAVEAAEKIKDTQIRIVSVPCMDLLWEQDSEYIQSLLCNNSIKVGIEAAIRQGWDSIIGAHNPFIGMERFGDSAPATELFKHFNITVDAIVRAVEAKLK